MTMDEFAQALSGMDPVELALGAGFAGILLVLTLFGTLIISAIGYYKMFKKAGEAGWKAFIPYYERYICFKISWNTKKFWPFLVALLLINYMPEAESFLVGIISIICMVVYVVLSVKLDLRVAKSFGKSTGWGVLLFFFPFIVSLILGFGSAKYVGNTTVAAKEELDV